MNIFVLDRRIVRCARYHADQHVIKMVLESVQILCTVLNEHGVMAPYRSTHAKHPCVVWAGESLRNWLWLRELAYALNEEYRYRYDGMRDHESIHVAGTLPEPPIDDQGLTPFAQAMPSAYKVPGDAVAAYRAFYVAEKSRFAKWTRRREPRWFTEGVQANAE